MNWRWRVALYAPVVGVVLLLCVIISMQARILSGLDRIDIALIRAEFQLRAVALPEIKDEIKKIDAELRR